jgi:hypothetical protein
VWNVELYADKWNYWRVACGTLQLHDQGRKMLAWVAVAALVCTACAALGFGSFFALTATGQSVAFLIMALSALVFLGAFDAYEETKAQSGPDPSEDG